MKNVNRMKWFFVFCLFFATNTMVHAQDWKSILSGVVGAVTDNKANLSGFTLEGTWNYVGPDCKFTSDNLLAQAGGEIASKKIEEKMVDILTKLGFVDGCSYTFKSDSTYTSVVKGHTTEGTYIYNKDTKELQMKTRLGLTFTAIVSPSALDANKMSLLFKADKLMSLIQTIGGVMENSSNSAVSTANALLKEYDGLQIGFELHKAS